MVRREILEPLLHKWASVDSVHLHIEGMQIALKETYIDICKIAYKWNE
jgi:hypothetical protein